jgi:hypothetical protein
VRKSIHIKLGIFERADSDAMLWSQYCIQYFTYCYLEINNELQHLVIITLQCQNVAENFISISQILQDIAMFAMQYVKVNIVLQCVAIVALQQILHA